MPYRCSFGRDIYPEYTGRPALSVPVLIFCFDCISDSPIHVEGALHIPLELLPRQLPAAAFDQLILVYDETGKKGHQALRALKGAGFSNVVNLSGGHTSLQRHGSVSRYTKTR